MACSRRVLSILAAWLAVSGATLLAGAQVDRVVELYEQTFGAQVPDLGKVREALALWQEVADKDPRAAYYLSTAYMQGVQGVIERNEARALGLLKDAADRGFPEAQFALAWQYESGELTPRDSQKALALYEKAATEGYVLAISRLVRAYSRGELGVLPDDAKADYWRGRR